MSRPLTSTSCDRLTLGGIGELEWVRRHACTHRKCIGQRRWSLFAHSAPVPAHPPTRPVHRWSRGYRDEPDRVGRFASFVESMPHSQSNTERTSGVRWGANLAFQFRRREQIDILLVRKCDEISPNTLASDYTNMSIFSNKRHRTISRGRIICSVHGRS
jgi:hypothetical protein